MVKELSAKDSLVLYQLFGDYDAIDIQRKLYDASEQIGVQPLTTLTLEQAKGLKDGTLAPKRNWLPAIDAAGFASAELFGTILYDMTSSSAEEEKAAHPTPAESTHTNAAESKLIDLKPYLGTNVETILKGLKNNGVYSINKSKISDFIDGKKAPELSEIRNLKKAFPDLEKIESDLQQQSITQMRR